MGELKKIAKATYTVCLSHDVGLGFRSKLRGAAPLLWNHHCSVSTIAPNIGLSGHFFVAVLFQCPVLLPFCLIPVRQCKHAEESHTCHFFSFFPAIFGGTQLCLEPGPGCIKPTLKCPLK